MSERFTDLAYITGDFKKANTSVSQAGLKTMDWFHSTHLTNYLKFKKEKPSISFVAGSFIHDFFQKNINNQDVNLNEAESEFANLIYSLDFAEEKQKIKAQFILKYIKDYVSNHLQAVEEISKSKNWQTEKGFSDWYDDKYMGSTLDIATEGYIDCSNDDEKIFTEHKNRFGSVRLSPLKMNSRGTTANRIGDWVYAKANKIAKPQFTHCMQSAVYSKHLKDKYKPFLVYVSETDYTIFNEDNCWELSPEGLKYFFKKFIQICIQRQEMMKFANGDIRRLACLIGVDWSEIRNYKSNFMMQNYHEEDMKKLIKFYEEL